MNSDDRLPILPGFVVWFLSRVTPAREKDIVLGDFEEYFQVLIEEKGIVYARLWSMIQLIDLIPRRLAENCAGEANMLRSYIRSSRRSLWRYKGFASINILGLAVGMACSLFVLIWVHDELTYDAFHENSDVIFRVEQEQLQTEMEVPFHVNVLPPAAGPALLSDIPEVIDATRFSFTGTHLVQRGSTTLTERGVAITDPSVFDMFSFQLLQGDPRSALSVPASVVLTRDTATRIFGREDPMGQTIILNSELSLRVTGVLANLPTKSSMQFNMLVPFAIGEELGIPISRWSGNRTETFVQLRPDADLTQMGDKITAVMDFHKGGDADATFSIMPLTDIYLKGSFGFGKAGGPLKYIYTFSLVGIFVLLIACINFMNLSTAQSARRAREIGFRKTAGAARGSIARQFLVESVMLSLVALLIAIALVALVLEPSNSLTGKDFTLDLLLNRGMLLGALSVALFTGLVAGSYPAIYLSGFNPIEIMRGRSVKARGNVAFRRSLVVVQFTLSVCLIIGTVTVVQQLNFMKEKDLGYDQHHVFTVPLSAGVRDLYQPLKSAFQQDPRVASVTGSWHRPSSIGSSSSGAQWQGKAPEDDLLIYSTMTDYDFVETMGLTMASGRDFSEDFPADASTDAVGNWVINETMADLMGMDSVLDQELRNWGVTGRIVGVVEDFHFSSLHSEIPPLAMMLDTRAMPNLVVRLGPGDVGEVLESLEATWKSLIPTYPFTARFLDADYDRLYRSEQRMADLLGYFSTIAILIACLGLVGLAAYTTEQRRREISIRRVLGATSASVSVLLGKEVVILVAVSNLVAWPLAYLATHNWLENFAYRIELGPGLFLVTGAFVTLIGILAIAYSAVHAVLADPVQALKEQ